MNNLDSLIEQSINKGKLEVLERFNGYINSCKEEILNKEYYLLGIKNLEKSLEKEYSILYDEINHSRDREIMMLFYEKRQRGTKALLKTLELRCEETYFIKKEQIADFLEKKLNKIRKEVKNE